MPTRTLVLLLATLGLIIIMVVAIVLTVVLTGNHAAKKADEQLRKRLESYSSKLKDHRCPRCGSELEIVQREGFKTYLKCKNDQCEYIADPDELLKK